MPPLDILDAMLRFEVRHLLDEPARDAGRDHIAEFITTIQDRLGRRPVSDRAWLELMHGGAEWGGAVLCHRDSRQLAGVCLIGRGSTWTVELVVDHGDADHADHADHGDHGDHGDAEDEDSGHREVEIGLLAAARDEIASRGGGDLRWWDFDACADADAVAAAIGLRAERSLLQMQIHLPLPSAISQGPDPHALVTRPFEVGRDEAAWLEVNSAAFAWHPEQGHWDLATIRLREGEDWFDPKGFLMHERDGRLAGFCWTKLHHDAVPVEGEIYVVAVHPDFHGLGLGKALTVAGLESIAARGVSTGMLFVDQDNAPAVGLYRSLGFHIRRIDRAYTGAVSGATPNSLAAQPPIEEDAP